MNPLSSLYDEYYGNYLSKETNYLSNLDNKSIIEILNNQWSNEVDLRRLRNNMNKVNIIYHKITSFSSKKPRDTNEYQGYFEIRRSTKTRKFFTSLKSVIKFLKEEKLNPIWGCSNG